MPIPIHGKEYYTVVERMEMMSKKTEGSYSLNTELIKLDGGLVVVKATLSFGGNEFSGHAMEEIGSSQINTTSALENCETSAIGRALASAGFHGTEFCSANELENALVQQKEKPVKKKSIKKSGGMSEQDRLETIPDYSDKDEIAFTDVPAEPTIKNIINFGKHNGKDWSELEVEYVDWVANKSNVDWQREEAKKELKRRS